MYGLPQKTAEKEIRYTGVDDKIPGYCIFEQIRRHDTVFTGDGDKKESFSVVKEMRDTQAHDVL